MNTSLAHFSKSWRILRPELEYRPGVAALEFAFGIQSYLGHGKLFLGRNDEARTLYSGALEAMQLFYASRTNTTLARGALASAHSNLGRLEKRSAQYNASISWYRSATRILSRASASDFRDINLARYYGVRPFVANDGALYQRHSFRSSNFERSRLLYGQIQKNALTMMQRKARSRSSHLLQSLDDRGTGKSEQVAW